MSSYPMINIDWIQLVLGAFFSLVPTRKFIRTECHYVGYRRLRKVIVNSPMSRQARRRNWKFLLGWVGLLRGYATAWLLNGAIQAPPDATRGTQLAVVGLISALLLLALWRQSEYRPKTQAPDQTVAPTEFLVGMMSALMPPMVTLSALLIGVAAAIAARSFTFGYGLASLVTLGSGLLFSRDLPRVGLWTLLVAFPLLINWLRSTDFVIPVRFKTSRAGAALTSKSSAPVALS